MSGLLHELRRRNVLRALAIYGAAAWLLVQIATQVFPFFDVASEAVRWIVIVAILGLPVVGVVSWFYELTPEGLKRDRDLERPPRQALVFDLRMLVALGLLFVLLLSGLAWRHLAQSTNLNEPALAVMPFRNLTDDADSGYFAEGVQDEILTRLAKIEALKVIARGSISSYTPRPEDLRKVARELGVSHVVQGSVQRRGDSARITVQLIAADSGLNVWAETYDRQLSDIFAVESEVATAIAMALQTRLSGRQKQALAQVPTHNQQAYDAYLRAIAYSPRRLDTEYLQRMAGWLERAVALDPSFALAWARLARVEANHAFYGIELARKPCQRAQHALDQASRLAPELGEIDLARGSVRLLCDDNLPAAEQAFRSARRRLPNSAEALQGHSQISLRRGDIAGALIDLRAAALLDPRDPQLLGTLALYLGVDRQFREAAAVADRVLNINPDDTSMLGLQVRIAQAESALDMAQQLLANRSISASAYEIFGAQVLQLIYRGRYAEASTALEKALSSDLSGIGVDAADYYLLLATAEAAAGRGPAARNAYQRGQELLKRNDDASLADLSSGGEYIRGMLCLFAVGLDPSSLDGDDCQRLRRIAATDSQFALTALEKLTQAEVLAGKTDGTAIALNTLLRKPYLSSRYTLPLTPALLRQDPVWAVLRNDPRIQKLMSDGAPVKRP